MRFRRADLMAFVALLFAAAALAFATQSGSLLHAQAPAGSVSAASSDSLAAPDGTIVPTFNYQGLLRDLKGNLVQGSHTIVVKLYADTIGGNPLNGPKQNNIPQGETFASVPVRDGVFNVVLGSTTPLDINIFANTKLYVGVAVDADAEMTPRQRIHPVPWALSASTANSAASADKATTLVDGASIPSINVTGNLTVNGVTNAKGGLSVDNLTITGVRQITNRIGQTTTTSYQRNAARWIIETDDQDTSYNPAKLDEARLADYCIDEDGCRIWIAMRNWTADRGPDEMVIAGPYNWTISKPGTGAHQNQRYYEFFDWNGESISRDGHNGGWDGDGQQWLAMSRWDCHLRDYSYVNGVYQPDSEMGFYFQNTEDAYPINTMTCVLIIED